MRCVGLVIIEAGRLLVIQRGREPGAGLWSLPGGRVEPGESDHEALVREAREETGLEVVPGRLAGSLRIGPYDVHDYTATCVGGLLRAGDDAADVRWVGLAELRSLPTTDGLVEILTGWNLAPL